MSELKKMIRAMLALALWLNPLSSALADMPDLIKGKKCDTCHRFSQDASKPLSEGPPLFFAGDKFQKDWLVAYLQKPEIIRKAGYINDPGFLLGQPVGNPHMALTLTEARMVADYLLTLKITGSAVAVDKEPLSGGNKAKTKALFERDYGCSACHETINLAGKTHGGISGPSLVNAGNRLNAEWILRQLKSPKDFLDKGRMPVFQLEDDVLLQLTRYIMTMKKENLK